MKNILFLLNIGNYINNSFTVERFHQLFKKHFAQKKNTELYGIQFININNFVTCMKNPCGLFFNHILIDLFIFKLYFWTKNYVFSIIICRASGV